MKKKKELQAEEQYCKLDNRTVLQKPISNEDLVKRIQTMKTTGSQILLISQTKNLAELHLLAHKQISYRIYLSIIIVLLSVQPLSVTRCIVQWVDNIVQFTSIWV